MVGAGLIMMFGIAVMIIGIIWTVFNKIKKRRFKKNLLSIGVGLVLTLLGIFIAVLVSSDYQVLNIEEGDKFGELVQSGENINDKTLTFIVAERGEESPMGVGLAIPASDEHLSILLESNSDTQSIQEGDTITVRIDGISNLLGIVVIQARLIKFENKL